MNNDDLTCKMCNKNLNSKQDTFTALNSRDSQGNDCVSCVCKECGPTFDLATAGQHYCSVCGKQTRNPYYDSEITCINFTNTVITVLCSFKCNRKYTQRLRKNKPLDIQAQCPCGTRDVRLERCSRCRLQHYCSKECQQKDWSKHKSVCQPSPIAKVQDSPVGK